ncbi:MAG: NRDE family protein [Bacteroidota bacterium]
MCTVSYLPQSEGGFLLTSNRDESPSRATHALVRQSSLLGNALLFPQDPRSGGTWICMADSGRLICLLNGAFEKHQHRPPYHRSRGLVVLDAFDHVQIGDFFERYSLEGIEPFTMVVIEGADLYEFRWDGQQGHLQQLDRRKPYIWSSITLYDATYRASREALFEDWLRRQSVYVQDEILKFHSGESGGTGDPDNDFVMNRRNVVRTVSISSVEKKDKAFYLLHKDLLGGTAIRQKLAFCDAEIPTTT